MLRLGYDSCNMNGELFTMIASRYTSGGSLKTMLDNEDRQSLITLSDLYRTKIMLTVLHGTCIAQSHSLHFEI